MKRSLSILVGSALAVTAIAGCGPSRPQQPPTELQNARAAYNRAESGPAAEYNKAGLIEARQALDAAEREHEGYRDTEKVKSLAYAAERKTELAEADARANAAAQSELEMQRALAMQSEQRAKVALDRLGLQAKDEPKGTVITVPGAKMFDTDKAVILPHAKARLGEIAKAVKSVAEKQAPENAGRKVRIIGYTDDVGNDEHNCELSERRAEAVEKLFTDQGIDPAIIETEGRGESNPIADNATPQGRAENRRVEVVITPAGKK
jgi:outer membrane protein OmpA-like peptidoglycan-associated protein